MSLDRLCELRVHQPREDVALVGAPVEVPGGVQGDELRGVVVVADNHSDDPGVTLERCYGTVGDLDEVRARGSFGVGEGGEGVHDGTVHDGRDRLNGRSYDKATATEGGDD